MEITTIFCASIPKIHLYIYHTFMFFKTVIVLRVLTKPQKPTKSNCVRPALQNHAVYTALRERRFSNFE